MLVSRIDTFPQRMVPFRVAHLNFSSIHEPFSRIQSKLKGDYNTTIDRR